MRAHRQPRLIPLDEAARTCGRPVDQLRRWCATGRLRGERVGTDWYLLEDDLHLAATLDELEASGGARTMISLAFSDEEAGRRALAQLRERFGAAAADLRLAPLALDGAELVLVAGAFPVEGLPEVLAVAHDHDGAVVGDVDEARLSRLPARPQEERRSSWN